MHAALWTLDGPLLTQSEESTPWKPRGLRNTRVGSGGRGGQVRSEQVPQHPPTHTHTLRPGLGWVLGWVLGWRGRGAETRAHPGGAGC